MNLPASVDDQSLLGHEPLLTHITMSRASVGCRSSAEEVVSQFLEAMQNNARAAAAAKKWACLIFHDDHSGRCSLELTDGGRELYRVFFKYQCLLYQGQQDNDFESAHQHLVHIARSGINSIKAVEPKGRCARTKHSIRGRRSQGGSKGNQRVTRASDHKKAPRQAVAGDQDSGGLATSSRSRSMTADPAIQGNIAVDSPPAAGTRRTTLSEGANLRKRSASKKGRKRKASSQKPPVITPSDASEDDKEPPKTHAVASASSATHRSKRVASNSLGQPHGLIAEDQVAESKSAHGVETSEQRRQGAISVSQRLSPLAGFTSDDFVSHSSIKGRHGARSPLSGRRRGTSSTVFTRPLRPRPYSRRPPKLTSAKDPRPPESKRMRRASMPTLHRNTREGLESARAQSVHEPPIQAPSVVVSPLTRESIRSKVPKVQRKRTRIEFETAFKVPDESASANPKELLGPDVRSLRPLPKKVRKLRLTASIPRVPYEAPSLEHADQLLRDAASNELAILREEARPDIPDWTQDKEHDAECDDIRVDDKDEVANDPGNTEPSAPTKPPVPAPPRIWAQSRQEVCESFEYFRCYHGGVYFKDDIVKGYLLGAYSASRDVFHHGGKLIISHGGGKSESIYDPRRGPKRYQTDQDQEASDISVRALLRTFKDRRPIVLLADDKYALFPYDLTSANYTYVVLGLYWISHAWAECQSARDGSGRIVRWKFSFQWCKGQGDPWWLPGQQTPITENTSGDPDIRCDHCREHSPSVYEQGWMCLNPRCHLFWSLNGEEPKELDYREEFLSPLPQHFERLPNITPTRVAETSDGITTTYLFSKGLHCTNCGRLSCRSKWEHWECPHCNFKHVVSGRVRSAKDFWHQHPPKGFLHSQIAKDSGILPIRLEPINLGTRKGFTNRATFILPHGRGKIHLILGTALSNGDANDIFQLYQQQASTGELKLRRYPLRNHRARGLLLTNYFSQNSGEPYQYVGGSGQTVPFSEAPECVRRALALIKERASLALCADVPFNEILSAAYMERQKMSFHSDSEKGLGPIVASLSLGSIALMHFRPHVNAENPTAKCTNVLTLVLRHGDVLIMEGDGVQKYYEHTVVPMNFRIAATARCIGTT